MKGLQKSSVTKIAKCHEGHIPFFHQSESTQNCGFLDFVHYFKNTTFQKMDLFPSSCEEGDIYSVGPLRKN